MLNFINLNSKMFLDINCLYHSILKNYMNTETSRPQSRSRRQLDDQEEADVDDIPAPGTCTTLFTS